jgi:hypothetical protein
MQFFTGIWGDVMRNTVMCQRNFGIRNAFCHQNLASCNTKYGNMSQEFRNTYRILSQEFRGLIRNTVMCQRNLGIQIALCHRNLEMLCEIRKCVGGI